MMRSASTVVIGTRSLAHRTETLSFMSDHWNLLADLLGTPNYAPRSKKASKNDATAKNQGEPVPPTPEGPIPSADPQDLVDRSISEPTSPSSDAQTTTAEQPREKSMLQSSWDALASLFGVASEQPREATKPQAPAQETPAPADPQRASRTRKPSEAKTESTGNPKPKRTSSKSMWDVSADDSSSEKQSSENASENSPVSTFGQPNSQRPVTSSRHDRDTDVDIDADRRGPRRSPRRGRDQVTADQSTDNQVQAQPPQREARSNRDRSNDQPRDDRRRDNPRNASRNNEGSREDSRRENRSNNDRDQRRPRNDKDTSSNVAPKELSKRPSRSGFAAGLSSDNDPLQVDDSIGFDSTSSADSENTQASSDRSRRKKRRGRKRDDQPSIGNANSERFDDASESEKDLDSHDRSSDFSDARPKHGKIPSWTEIIGVVVQANVANHQKHASGGRGRQRRPN